MKSYLGTRASKFGTLSQEIKDWEFDVAIHKKFMCLTPENRALFFALLGKENDLDSYATSPVYYAITGRRGLWIYQDGNSYVPLCWHPNIEGQILVFPPRGKENPHILKRLLTEIPIPPAGIKLARIKKDDLECEWLKSIQSTAGRLISIVPVEEFTLDWRYPVRILSTEKVAKLEGGHYYRIRNYISQAKRHNIRIESLSANHAPQIISFAYRWANRRTTNAAELINLVSPYQQTMDLLKDEHFNLDGLVFYIDGHIQAVTIWEPPNTSTQIANAWVNLSNTSYKGISEFVMKSVAETLYAKGILYLNFGGSETKGLDDYKEKYIPTHSVQLCSMQAEVDGVDLVLDSLMKFHETRAAV